LIPSTPFNAFQRPGFALVPSASQSFGDGVYVQTRFPNASRQRHLSLGLNVWQLPVMVVVVAWL